jgi:hypothetical protein
MKQRARCRFAVINVPPQMLPAKNRRNVHSLPEEVVVTYRS